MCSFELASFVVLDITSLLRWIATGSPRKSIWERLGGNKVSSAWCKCDRFHARRPLDKAKWTYQRPGVRADAQCCKITWLEELASESNTIQAQEDISQQGKMEAQTRWNYIYFCDGFSSISRDTCIRLSSRLLWYKILSVCFIGLQRGHPENPCEKDWTAPRSR